MSDQTTQEVGTEAQQPQVQLQISDILTAAQVIQLASTRGAFRAEEFSQIGVCYDRMIAFLQASGALQQATPAEGTPADASTETPAV